MPSSRIAPAVARAPAAPSIEGAPSPTTPERNVRKSMELGGLCKGKINAKSPGEKAVVALGRQELRRREQLPTAELIGQTNETWQDDLITYATVSHIEPGDVMNFEPGKPPKGGIPITFKGRELTVISADPLNNDGDGAVLLRVAEDSGVIPVTDCLQDISQTALKKLNTAPAEETTTPEAKIAKSFFEGKTDIDPQEAKEVAQNLGFVTPDSILEIAKDKVGPDGKPLLTESDLKILSGQQVEIPPVTPLADGSTPESVKPPQPELSETAKKLQEIFNNEQMLDAPQVKAALFALGIPTDSSQLRDVLRDSQNELTRREDELSKFTHQGESEKLAWLEAQKNRIKQLQETVKSYTTLNKNLEEETGSNAFDTVTAYYDVVENGGGDAQFLESFITAIKEPTVDNIAKFDESYATRAGEHTKSENTKKRKAFLKKFVMGAGLGMGGLMAFNVWRATKKDEK